MVWERHAFKDIIITGTTKYEIFHQAGKYKVLNLKGDQFEPKGRIAKKFLEKGDSFKIRETRILSYCLINDDTLGYEIFDNSGETDALFVREVFTDKECLITYQRFVF